MHALNCNARGSTFNVMEQRLIKLPQYVNGLIKNFLVAGSVDMNPLTDLHIHLVHHHVIFSSSGLSKECCVQGTLHFNDTTSKQNSRSLCKVTKAMSRKV